MLDQEGSIQELKSVHNQQADEYYYCSKKVRFPKRKIIQLIYDFFIEQGQTVAFFEDIYVYLQKKLSVSSVNRQHLRELLDLCTNIVTFKRVETLWKKYADESYEPTFESLPISFAQKLSDAIDVLGWEFVRSYLLSDGQVIHGFLLALNSSMMQKPLSIYHTLEMNVNLRNYICAFSEEEIISLLQENPALFCSEYYEFVERQQEKRKIEKFVSQIKQKIQNISPDNLQLKLSYLLKPSIASALKEKGISRVEDFVKLDDNQLIMFYGENQELYLALISTLQNSLITELQKGFEHIITLPSKINKPNKDWERFCAIMYYRLRGNTLASVGEQFGVTRERVRQVEAKYIRYFRAFFYEHGRGRINLMRSYATHYSFMSDDELKSLIGKYYELFIFLLDKIEGDEILFANELNIILFEEGIERYEAIQNIAANLPNSFSEAELNNIAEDIMAQNISLGIDFSFEIIKAILTQDYKLTGTIYSRYNMPLSQRYVLVLKKGFPNGVHIYDESELKKFREVYIGLFGEDRLPESNRAIIGRVTAIAILCGKGTYIAKADHLISEDLLADICAYIDESEQEIFLTNTLFYVFEDRLVSEGINNKYHLQGILHALAQNRYFFSRDYVSKSKELTSLYSFVVAFIRNAGKIVSKEEIYKEFPALPDIILTIACQDQTIINCYGKYVHKDFLIAHDEQLVALKEILIEVVNDGVIHSSDDIMCALSLMHSDILKELSIDSQYTLFSIIKAVFEQDFSLSRPYIAKNGVEIGSTSERIRSFLAEKDETEIAELIEFTRENSLRIWNFLKQINEFNDEYFLKNKLTIIKIGATGLTKYQAIYIDDFIEDILCDDDCVIGSKIRDYALLPKINIPWNEWLLYSAVNKWSTKYKVITTDSQFRNSEPVFLRKEIQADNLDELLQYIASKHHFNEVSLMSYMREKGMIK